MQTQISRSKAFNLQMLILTALPAGYFWVFEDNYIFNSSIMSCTACWLVIFSLISIFYIFTLALEVIHSSLGFRLFCRGLPLLSVGLWKLVFTAFM